MFITLEGPEGSGKTSHLKPLAEWLNNQGYKVFTTREPGGTPLGEQVRSVILDYAEMNLRTETLLYQATRAQLVEQVIRPKLLEGQIAISDRYIDSTLAYQGYGHNQDLNQMRELVKYATNGLFPDLTFLLDIDVEVGLKRKANGSDWNRLDAQDIEFHKRVRLGYLELVKQDPARWIVINAEPEWQIVQKLLQNSIISIISKAKTPTIY